MRDSMRYFNISPKIVAEGSESIIKVEPLYGHKGAREDAKYELIHSPMESRGFDETGAHKRVREIIPRGGHFEFSLLFEGEQEHRIEIREILDGGQGAYCEFSIYSLGRDLYPLRPYKGDLHMHSSYSDGRESPAYVAGACRRIGLDFMALTDHGQYGPSLKAQEAYEDLVIDLKILPGEEIHPPDNYIHMINFGGNFSVNDLINAHEDDYYKEVQEIMEKEGADLPEKERYIYASCKWCFERVRQGGGLGIYCHPYWVYENMYNVSNTLHDYIYNQKPFDAYELIGGFHLHEAESNHLQVAYYQEERAKGVKMPIVGVSDAHGCDTGELFGWYYTVVLSPDLELSSLIGGIKDLKSVAVEALPGSPVRVYGPYRLVKYVLFLIREVFPLHDELCYEEGRLMLEYIAGNEDAAKILEAYRGRVRGRMDSFWA
ncbi:MAG TPA: PHP domain-containing protein [Clostridia bacterium]|nr:PHP domain-containing protein [Clostridia bacterium]